jgi:hypothetical protein
VLDTGCIERPAKGLDVGGDDIRVRASEQAQDRACVACCLHRWATYKSVGEGTSLFAVVVKETNGRSFG